MGDSQDDLTRLHMLHIYGTPRKALRIIQVDWRPPHLGLIKVNTDTSWQGQLGVSACGGIFKNFQGFVVGCFSQNLGRGFAFEAEIIAAMLAIEIAFEKIWHNLWLEFDSVYVVSLFASRSHTVPWNHHNRWLAVITLMNKMSIISLYIYHEGNGVVDALARAAHGNVWQASTPNFISKIIAQDFVFRPRFRFSSLFVWFVYFMRYYFPWPGIFPFEFFANWVLTRLHFLLPKFDRPVITLGFANSIFVVHFFLFFYISPI